MRYFWITVKHKWFVLLAGLKTGAPLWRLIIHDWSKFTPMELPHYQRQFFGKADQPERFHRVWLHHQNHNPHHWEYWIPRSGRVIGRSCSGEPIVMPMWAVREMVADWMGAGRAYEGEWPRINDWTWFNNALPEMKLDPITLMRVFDVLNELGMMPTEKQRLVEIWRKAQ